MTGVSTRLYVYAILDAPVPPIASDLEMVQGPACWLAVKTIAANQIPQATADALAAQDAIVRALATRAAAVLPLRFGTSFQNEAALRASLAEIDGGRLREALARVRGCEQMIVRAFQNDAARSSASAATNADAAAASGPGTAYLAQRAAALAATPARLQPLRERLASIVREEIAEAAPRPPLLESMYHLIARGDAPRYTAIVATWPPPADLVVRASGPSPVYAFAKDALS
jgi:hypothetical protein